MSNDKSILDQIAEEVGTITEKQDDDDSADKLARDGEEFDPQDYERNKDDYDGDW